MRTTRFLLSGAVLALIASGCESSPQEPSPRGPAVPAEIQEPVDLSFPLPNVVGKGLRRAVAILEAQGLFVDVKRRYSGKPKNTVLDTSPAPGSAVELGGQVRLIVARPRPEPAPPPPPESNCHPSYEGACLLVGAGDYDCAGGSGNGPNYTGTVRVVGPDEYGLDGDGDGIGCE